MGHTTADQAWREYGCGGRGWGGRTLYGNIEVMRTLLEYGANVGAEDKEGRTPLHQATSNWSVESGPMCMLLEHGADVNARTIDSSTLLLATVKYENIEVVRALLDIDANVAAENEEGRSPLHQATSSGSTELVRTLLLEHGADINAQTKDSSTPLLMR